MANHIESVSCSVQTIDLPFSSISDTPAVSKVITRLFRQSHLTHPELESSIPGVVTEPDDSSLPEIATDPLEDQLNPQCMTKEDWVEAQSRDKTLSEIIHLFKNKGVKKVNETDKNVMRQFIRQQNKLFMRNGILYGKMRFRK